MPLNEQERDGLVEELAEAMHDVNLARSPELFDTWEVEQTVEARHPDTGYVTLTREQATACLPFIDRLLAAHDLDALLDSVGASGEFFKLASGKWTAIVRIRRNQYEGFAEWAGTGRARMDALRDAVAQAKEAGK